MRAKRGARITVSLAGGQTALHLAAIYGRAAMVRFLLNRGADINSKTKDGKTPLDVAGGFGKTKGAAEVLRQHKGESVSSF